MGGDFPCSYRLTWQGQKHVRQGSPSVVLVHEDSIPPSLPSTHPLLPNSFCSGNQSCLCLPGLPYRLGGKREFKQKMDPFIVLETKPELKVSEGWCLLRPLCLSCRCGHLPVSSHSLPFVCVYVITSSFYKDTSSIGLDCVHVC